MKNLFAALLIASTSAYRLRGDDDFPHWMHGFGGYKTYKRDLPNRFTEETDDQLMKSMYENYATEGKAGNGQPNGHFWLTKEDALRASDEVVGTHLKLEGAKKKAFLDENFPHVWARFDVNEEGKVEIDRMPQFLRQICGNTEACIGL